MPERYTIIIETENDASCLYTYDGEAGDGLPH